MFPQSYGLSFNDFETHKTVQQVHIQSKIRSDRNDRVCVCLVYIIYLGTVMDDRTIIIFK